MNNPLVLLADFVVPPLLGLVFCLRFGPNRGVLYAVLPMLLAVLALFYLQVSSGPVVDGKLTASRFQVGWGYMLSEAIVWLPTFLVGCAVGSVIWKRRQ